MFHDTLVPCAERRNINMKKLTRQEKHEQCMREIRGTLIVVLICCAWHIALSLIHIWKLCMDYWTLTEECQRFGEVCTM